MFKVSQKGLSTKEVLDICIAGNIDARTVCRAVPQGVNQSAIFVVDLKIVDEGDLTTDGNGVCARHSSPTEFVSAEISSQSFIKRFERCKKGKKPKGNHVFAVKRHYSWHTSSDEFCRIITKVLDHPKGELGRYAVIQYKVIEKAKEQFCRKMHGNAKHHKEVYLRTKPSVISKIKDYAKEKSAKLVIKKVQDEAGGVAILNQSPTFPVTGSKSTTRPVKFQIVFVQGAQGHKGS